MGVGLGILISGLASALGSAGSSIFQNISNSKNIQDTNDTNKEIAKSTNDANKEMQAAVNATNMEIAERNNIASARQAEIARNWQKEMSDTAHQREMADLKAAGINPILAANNGATTGAATQGIIDVSGKAAASRNSAFKNSPAQLDLTGVSSALNALQSTMLTYAILRDKNNVSNNDLRTVVHSKKSNTSKALEIDEKKLEELKKLIG